jgi:hypothetical protein
MEPALETVLKRERMQAAPGNLAALICDLFGFLIPLIDTPVAASNRAIGGPWSTKNMKAIGLKT